jgi:hypothetical protein
MNTEKKQWVTPTATEIEVNGGAIFKAPVEGMYNVTAFTSLLVVGL